MMLDKLMSMAGNGTVEQLLDGAEEYADQVDAKTEEVTNNLLEDTRAQNSGALGVVISVVIALVVALTLFPVVFDQWDSIGEVPTELDGIVVLVPLFGVLAIAIYFIGMARKAM